MDQLCGNHHPALPYFREALRDIPQHEKLEYLQALRVAPHLVETESDPVAFLRFCEWDATAAARRLTVYWRKRKELFGEERAFLPLDDLSGNGALGSEEIEALQSGAVCLMPDDNHGRPILYYDRRRFPPALIERGDVKLRAIFWVYQRASRSTVSQTTGSVFITLRDLTPRRNCIQKEAIELCREAFPLRCHTSHLVYLKERRTLYDVVVPFILENLWRPITFLVVHTCESVGELVPRLAQHGIPRESLPRRLGGFVETDPSEQTGDCMDVDEKQVECAWLSPLIEATPVGNNELLQQKHDVNDGTLSDMESVEFCEMLDRLAVDEAEGSPFEPRPIQSSPQHQPQHQPQILAYSSGEAIDLLKRDLPTLHESLCCFPETEKAAFEEAVRRAPAVVQTESDPLMYLRFQGFDIWAATKRLLLYWECRVRYFGDRAFLPLTQTMGGALWEEDIHTLASGVFFLLPSDSRGHPVLGFDPSRLPEYASKASFIRVAMYFFSIICSEHPAAITEGCVVLVFISTRIMELSKFRDGIRTTTDLALDSFPIKNYELHVFYYPPRNTSPLPSFTSVVVPKLFRALGRLLIDGQAQFYVGETVDELQRKLALCGLSGAALEAAVNGGINDHDFAQWMKNRQLCESTRRTHSEQQQKKQEQPPLLLPVPDGATQPFSLGLQQDQLQVPFSSPIPDGTTHPCAHGLNQTEHHQSSTQSSFPESVAPSKTDWGKVPFIVNKGGITVGMASVSSSEKRAYLEAMEKVPDLVKKESDPDRFLRSENYNESAAAERLAAYWRIRCDIFGERAFLPMDQTADGALDRKDVVTLQTGFMTQLPNDASGRSVVCCDGSLLEENAAPQSQLRVMFYVWTLLSWNDLSQKDGYSVLYAMTWTAFDQACSGNLKLVMEAHPVKLKCFHLLACCPGGISEHEFGQGAAVKNLLTSLSRSVQDNVIVHVCESRAGFANKLVGCGMRRKEGVPETFGGKWGIEEFLEWQELRVRHEWELPIRDQVREAAENYGIRICATRVPPNLNGDQKSERKRRLMVLRSRIRRERDRHQLHLLQVKCNHLRKEQNNLLLECRRLEDLFQNAEAAVAAAGK